MSIERPSADALPACLRLPDLLVGSATRAPEARAAVFDHQDLTFGDLLDRVVLRSRLLLAAGVRPGDRVGLLAYNTPEFLVDFFAATMLRGVATPLLYRYGPEELRTLLDIAEPTCLAVDGAIWPSPEGLDDLLARVLPALRHPRHLEDRSVGVPVVVASNYEGHLPGIVRTEAVTDAAESVPADAVWRTYESIKRRDPATLLFTSGTASRPKGVLHASGAQAQSAMSRSHERLARAPVEIAWTPTPWSHTGGLLAMLGALGHGDTVATSPFFSASAASRLLSEQAVTTAWLMFPAIIQRLAEVADAQGCVYPSVRQALHIGNEHWFRESERLFPNARVLTGYGMTESGSLFSLAGVGETRERRQSTCGRPYEGIELRIIDPATGDALDPGVAGEVCFCGWNLFCEYLGDSRATADAVDVDGWFRTGDLGLIDEFGYLRLLGRVKDVLKVGGENVSPSEVEEVLLAHPAVTMAAVVGIPDQVLGDIPVAFVELAQGSVISGPEIREHCRGRLARFKIPKMFLEIGPGGSEWPQSATKVDKTTLVEWARGGDWPDVI